MPNIPYAAGMPPQETNNKKNDIIMNYKWTYEEAQPDEAAAAAELAREVGIHPALGKLLRSRGIYSPAEAKRFFKPQITDLHDPFLMDEMREAVDRLNEAMGRKERVLVYGDYDVDGCTAVALVYKFLQQYYSNVDFYIPTATRRATAYRAKASTMPPKRE